MSEVRLIDANALKEDLFINHHDDMLAQSIVLGDGFTFGVEYAALFIDNAPTIKPTVDKDYLIRLIQEAVYDGEACARLMDMVEPKQEWIPCSEIPDTDRNVFIARGTPTMKSCCIGHYEHDLKLWYEDKNWFASPIYDGMYWCEIPTLPTTEESSTVERSE